MITTESTTAFQALVQRYEANGWDVRTLDEKGQRATVRLSAQANTEGTGGDIAPSPSGCRKLWVDAAGEVQETNIPC